VATVGFHASHEQFAPSRLLECVRLAEQAGFQAAMCSDHIIPWSERQGESGFAWSWLGAAMQATSLPFGVVNAPGQRYHPAIIAQAAATLAEMFPGRFWLAVGSGELINEHITGGHWPPKAERNARLKECVDVMRSLWAGETVTHKGLVVVEEAKLYTRPQEPPAVIGAAITPETAEWLGGWADGLITVSRKRETLAQVVEAFRRGGGEGKPMYLQVKLAYTEDEQAARAEAHREWRNNILKSVVLADLKMPAQFDAVGKYVRPEDLDGHIRISSDLEQHLGWLQEDVEQGFEGVYLHNVCRNQEAFIEVFGERVLPHLR
jgi:coenzyme F420-dependent glucose-6-phosphate dehydrogenase